MGTRKRRRFSKKSVILLEESTIPMNPFQRKKITIATSIYILLFVVMGIAEISYFWFARQNFWSSPKEKNENQKDQIRVLFNPAQVNRLKSFLENIKPGENRLALLQTGKIYNLPQSIFLREINSKNKIILQVEGYEKDPTLRTTITSLSWSPIKIKKSTQIIFRGIQFISPSSSPVISIEDCDGIIFENCAFKGGEGLKIKNSYNVTFRKAYFKELNKKSLDLLNSEKFLITNCRFQGNNKKGYGIYVAGISHKSSFSGTIQSCTFEGFQVGIYLSSTELNIYKNKIQKNDIGIYFDGNSKGEVGGEKRENIIQKNQKEGIRISGKSSPEIKENQIQENLGNGITIEDQSAPTIIRALVSKNLFSGIEISDSSTPSILNNEIIHNGKDKRKYGIFVKTGARAMIENNKISGNGEGGIHLKKCGKGITIQKNNIENNEGFGIFFEQVDSKIRKQIQDSSNQNKFHQNKFGRFGPGN